MVLSSVSDNVVKSTCLCFYRSLFSLFCKATLVNPKHLPDISAYKFGFCRLYLYPFNCWSHCFHFQSVSFISFCFYSHISVISFSTFPSPTRVVFSADFPPLKTAMKARSTYNRKQQTELMCDIFFLDRLNYIDPMCFGCSVSVSPLRRIHFMRPTKIS